MELQKQTFGGDVTYVHAYHTLNYIPARDLALRVRKVMIRVDKTLEAKCGIKDLIRDMEEECNVHPSFPDSRCP